MFPYVPSEVRISTEIPPRGHIPALWERIEGEMMSRGAKFNTLCPIRAEEHRKLFDELIRQVLVQSPEQGETNSQPGYSPYLGRDVTAKSR